MDRYPDLDAAAGCLTGILLGAALLVLLVLLAECAL